MTSVCSCVRENAPDPRRTGSSCVCTVSALKGGQRGPGSGVGRGRVAITLFLSTEAPEEPSIKVNDLGISVNSEEPEEVSKGAGKDVRVRQNWDSPAGQGDSALASLLRWPLVRAGTGTPFLKSSGTRTATL